jgi:hypothetical protein
MMQFLMAIAVLLSVFALAFAMQRGIENKSKAINLEKEALSKTINMFDLFRKSLKTTWRISTAQAIFDSSNGFDFNNGYWYSYDPSEEKKIEFPEAGCSGNPSICLLTMPEISFKLGEIFKNKYSGPIDGKMVTANFVELVANNIESVIWPGDGVVVSKVKQIINTRTEMEGIANSLSIISRTEEIENFLETDLRKRTYAGYMSVEKAVDISKDSEDLKYEPVSITDTSSGTQGPTKFREEAKTFIEKRFNEIKDFYNNIKNTQGTGWELNKMADLKFLIPSYSTGSEPSTLGVLPDQSGIILKYDTTLVFEELSKYYKDTGNSFKKEPFDLKVKIKDYLPVLNCSEYPDGTRFMITDSFERIFKLDAMCFKGPKDEYREIYTCDRWGYGRIEGLNTQENDIKTGQSIGEYQCVTNPDIFSGEIFCRQFIDGVKEDPRLARCCTQWNYADNAPDFWAGDSSSVPNFGTDNRCNGNTFCIGDTFTEKSKGEMCDTRKTCSTYDQADAIANGCSYYCDSKGHKFSCQANQNNCGDFNRAYSWPLCDTTCGPGSATYDGHGNFATGAPQATSTTCFNADECRLEEICKNAPVPLGRGDSWRNPATCEEWTCSMPLNCPFDKNAVYNPFACNDGNECTADLCDGSGGCTHHSSPYGTPCSKGICDSGVCIEDLPEIP